MEAGADSKMGMDRLNALTGIVAGVGQYTLVVVPKKGITVVGRTITIGREHAATIDATTIGIPLTQEREAE